VDLLLKQRKGQLEDRLKAGSLWQDGDYVFTGPVGHPLDPSNCLHAVTDAAAAVGLPGVNVHTLRHTAATLMLRAGVPVKDVSVALGHADVRITLEVYAHATDDHAAGALGMLAAALDG
jgi:integrase